MRPLKLQLTLIGSICSALNSGFMKKKIEIIDNVNLWYLPFKPLFTSSKLLLDIKRKYPDLKTIVEVKTDGEIVLDTGVRI